MISINYTNNNRSIRKVAGIAGAFITLAIPFIIMMSSDAHELEHAQSFCPFKMLTGFPCPGCGITKSIISFYQGNIIKSFGFHLFGAFTVLLCVFAIIVLSVELITKKEYFQHLLFNKKIAMLLGATLAVYHLIRLVYFISENNIHSILQQSIWQ